MAIKLENFVYELCKLFWKVLFLPERTVRKYHYCTYSKLWLNPTSDDKAKTIRAAGRFNWAISSRSDATKSYVKLKLM